MGLRQYNLGIKHGREGIRAMAHRNCRQYDSRSANESYIQGYKVGAAERLADKGKVGLDYSRPENNRLFKP
jgi:hypothetical protein